MKSILELLKDAADKHDGRMKYLQIPCAFDTEVSSFVEKDGLEVGLVYSWAFGLMLDGVQYVTLGRYIEEFTNALVYMNDIVSNVGADVIIYVHNLQYDISFIYKIVPFDKIFMVDSRKVLYAKYKHIIFRDSLLLSGGRSLDAISRNLRKYKVRKLVGSLDYDLVRGPETPLTDKERSYQINDVRCLLAYIQEKIEMDGGLAKVPLTNTGYVRNALRDSYRKNYQRSANLIDQLVLPPAAYWVLKQCQAGGFTHAGEGNVNKVLYDVGSYDIKSSYPAVILTEYFPMSAPQKVKTESLTMSYFEELCSKYCVTAIIKLENVVTISGHEYTLSESKAVFWENEIDKIKELRNSMAASYFNGRLRTCKWIRYGFTELSWDTFKKFYRYEKATIEECWIYERGRLPKTIVVPMLTWFAKKTTLDGVDGSEVEYMISKNMLNAIAGCMEMDPVRNIYDYDYDNRVFLPKQKPDIEASVQKTNEDPNRFLYFPWGVWILDHARHKLLDVVAHTGADHVYSDTDSEKLLNYQNYKEYFDSLNNELEVKLRAAGEYYNVGTDVLIPKKPNGEEARLGVFEYEGVYKRFKTLGAKRYLGEYYPKKDKEYSTFILTVAGLNKRLGLEYLCGAELDHINNDFKRVMKPSRRCRRDYTEKELTELGTHTANKDPFDSFNMSLEVPPENAGRLVLKYIDDPRSGVYFDYLGNIFEYHVESGVYAKKAGYKISSPAREYTSLDVFFRFTNDVREDTGEA